jgi:ribose transport system ATP-binding protein
MASATTPTTGTAVSVVAGEGAIQVTNVKKYFGVTRALDGCSFSARLGEIHAIVGGNGCGKSTLAKVLSGVLPFDSGQVTVLGRTPTSPAEARDVGIATTSAPSSTTSIWDRTTSSRRRRRHPPGCARPRR